MNMRSVRDVGDVRGKRVLLRLDLNVPVRDGVVADDFRIRKSMPTIELLRGAGAKLIVVSHCEGKESKTLRPAFEYLKKSLPVSFIETYIDSSRNIEASVHAAVDALGEGEILLLENLRQHEGEKENDPIFAAALASLADMYVNEAFSASHREHASIVGVPKIIPGYAGLLLQTEVEHLSKTFTPPHPFLFILGGAKFDTKIPLIKKFLPIADKVFVGGALANNFFKEFGEEVGDSVVSDGEYGLKELFESGKVVLPQSVIVKQKDGSVTEKSPYELSPGDSMVDAGVAALNELRDLVAQAKYVLWNGPLGNFEIGFKEQTLGLASIIAEHTTQDSAGSVLGGADTLAAISELGIENNFSFVSSGGGAMLDFLANGTLPGIEVLK